MFKVTTDRQHALGTFVALAVAVVLTLLATSASACASLATQAALLDREVAGKFSATAQLCAQASRAVPPSPVVPHVAVRGRDPAPPEPTVVLLRSAPELHRASTGTGGVKAAAALASAWSSAAPLQAAGLQGRVGRDAARRALALAPQIDAVAAAYRIDPLLLHAIAHVESRHNPAALSHAGARGLMQVMPQTGRRFGAASSQELFDPKVSLEVSAAYLKALQARFGNNLSLVIAAYNAGEGAVEKYGRSIPPYAETRGYVKSVMSHYRLLLSARSGPAAR